MYEYVGREKLLLMIVDEEWVIMMELQEEGFLLSDLEGLGRLDISCQNCQNDQVVDDLLKIATAL